MKRIAILFSGNMRNVLDIQNNLNENLINPLIKSGYEYDIFIHTWNSNLINDTVHSNDRYVKTNDVQNILNALKKRFRIKNIIIENQEAIFNKNGGDKLIHNIMGNRDVRGKGKEYTFGLVKKHYFQYYGQYKSFDAVKGNYDYIIKTRPDVWYFEKFDLKLFDNVLSFPFSHQFGGTNINQIFYVGKFSEMKMILDFWKYMDSELNILLESYPYKHDINFNQIFRHYITNVLNIPPTFVKYNPGIYRSANKIVSVG